MRMDHLEMNTIPHMHTPKFQQCITRNLPHSNKRNVLCFIFLPSTHTTLATLCSNYEVKKKKQKRKNEEEEEEEQKNNNIVELSSFINLVWIENLHTYIHIFWRCERYDHTKMLTVRTMPTHCVPAT